MLDRQLFDAATRADSQDQQADQKTRGEFHGAPVA
jgi:hypothetical protein